MSGRHVRWIPFLAAGLVLAGIAVFTAPDQPVPPPPPITQEAPR